MITNIENDSVAYTACGISSGGPHGLTADTTLAEGKGRAAGGEVGAVHSSEEGGNDAGARDRAWPM